MSNHDPADTSFGPEVVVPPTAVANTEVVTVGRDTAHLPTLANLLPQMMASLFAREQAQEAADAVFASSLRDVSVLISTLQLTTQIRNQSIRQAVQKAVLVEMVRSVEAI